MEKEKLYMPQGLNTNKEFLKGLEYNSFGIMGIIILFLNIPNVIITIFLKKPIIFTIWYITLTCMFSYMVCIKDNSNISVFDMFGFFIKFIRTQKKYEYISKDEMRS